MTTLSSDTLHASCVAIDGRAVLIEGPSGAGKSDLALRLIDRGATLVSDDYTLLVRRGKALVATPPPTIKGKIEIRGIGIVELTHVDAVPVALVVSLETEIERMPLDQPLRKIIGIELPLIALDPRPASAPIKVEMALRRVSEKP